MLTGLLIFKKIFKQRLLNNYLFDVYFLEILPLLYSFKNKYISNYLKVFLLLLKKKIR